MKNNNFGVREKIVIQLLLFIVKMVGKPIDGLYLHELKDIENLIADN